MAAQNGTDMDTFSSFSVFPSFKDIESAPVDQIGQKTNEDLMHAPSFVVQAKPSLESKHSFLHTIVR